MASCITSEWAGYAPQARLNVTQTSETGSQVTLSWTLEYVVHGGYAASTDGVAREYTVKINNVTPTNGSGSFNINGVSSTKTIASGTATVNKGTSAQNISFSVSFRFGLTWSGVYKNTLTASGSISIKAKTKYTISYKANGGDGTTPATQTKYHDSDIYLQSASGLSKAGHSFSKWNTSADGSGTPYNAGAKYSANSDATMYAVWSTNNYTVTYNTNGGEVTPTSRSVAYGSSTTLPTPTRDNYNFAGWNTNANGTGTSYSAGASYTVYGNVTLYAQWTLAWYKPKIRNVSVNRTGEDNTNALVTFDWETTYDVETISIDWSSATDSGSSTVIASGRSGNVSQTVGNSTLDVDHAYTIKITVSDSNGDDYRVTTLPSVVFPIDVYQEGTGIAFGKAAEKDGFAEFEYDAQFNKSVQGRVFGLDALPTIPSYSDFNDTRWMTPGCYRVDTNVHALTMTNCPCAYAGRLIVASATGERGDIGLYDYQYVFQEYIPLKSDQPRYYRTVEYTIDSSEIQYYDWVPVGGGNRVLWSGGLYMTETQSITLSEPISKQSSGIQLVFSLYRNNTAEDASINTFFVSKKEVELLKDINNGKGAPHTFIMGINAGFSVIGAKYLYINDTTIRGHEGNNDSGTNSGITFNNASYVLRYVIGV